MDFHIFTGHLGSGKTEVAVNFALHTARRLRRHKASAMVAVVDIDVINPYFAAREARKMLESQGIQVAAPSLDTTSADVRVLSGDIYRLFHSEGDALIVDVGGDPAGARILGSLHEHVRGQNLQVYCVVNTKRPLTRTRQGILSYIHTMSAALRLSMTGLIHNTHLLHETTGEDMCQGQQLLEQVAEETGLPVVLTTVMKEIAAELDGCIGNPLLVMERHIQPPYAM